jgi:hypothetical protein
MSQTPTDNARGVDDVTSEPVPDTHASSAAPRSSETDHPRLIEEHHVAGPYGEDELEATDEQGRRWYHLRPQPRRRVDFIGFNYVWWLIWIMFILVVFLPWGRGWGY